MHCRMNMNDLLSIYVDLLSIAGQFLVRWYSNLGQLLGWIWVISCSNFDRFWWDFQQFSSHLNLFFYGRIGVDFGQFSTFSIEFCLIYRRFWSICGWISVKFWLIFGWNLNWIWIELTFENSNSSELNWIKDLIQFWRIFDWICCWIYRRFWSICCWISINIWLNFDVISIDFDWIFGSIWATDFVPLVLLWISGAVNRTSFRCISDFSEKEEKKEDFRRCLLSFAVVLRVRFRLFCGQFIQIRVTFTATSVTRGCDNWNKSVSLDGFHFLGLK